MKILVHFQFSFLLKIENNFTTQFSKFIFHFLNCGFFDFFFQIFEKKLKQVHFSVSQKINKWKFCF